MDVVSNATLKQKADKDSLLAALNMLDAVHPQVGAVRRGLAGEGGRGGEGEEG